MEKQFCTFEVALKLKELGFDEPCFGYYAKDNLILSVRAPYYPNKVIKAPLWLQTIDWLETKGYYVNITRVVSWNTAPPEFKGWCVYIGTNNAEEMLDCNEFFIENFYPTKYEAREQAILKAIELCQK